MENILDELDKLRKKVELMEEEKRVVVEKEEQQTPKEPIAFKVARKLKELGVPPQLSGYRYLRSAIVEVYEDFRAIEGTTTLLYPKIAEEYGTTPSRIERAIRHAIEAAYGSEDKPTSRSFIAHVADELRMEDGKY